MEAFATSKTTPVEIRRLQDGNTKKEEFAKIILVLMSASTTESVKVLKSGFADRIIVVVMVLERMVNKLSRSPPFQIGWNTCLVRIRVLHVLGFWV